MVYIVLVPRHKHVSLPNIAKANTKYMYDLSREQRERVDVSGTGLWGLYAMEVMMRLECGW